MRQRPHRGTPNQRAFVIEQALGLEGQVGELTPGKLADLIVLDKDPLADITVLQGGKNLSCVIKDGKIVDLDRPDEMLTFRQAAE